MDNKVVALYQGASLLLKQKVTPICEASDNSHDQAWKISTLMRQYRKSGTSSRFQLEQNGKYYDCFNPIQSSSSLYVAHYEPFLKKISTNGLQCFGFSGDLGKTTKSPYVSFSKAVSTAVKYAFGVIDPSWDQFSGEMPYYDDLCVPSVKNIGTVLICLPKRSELEDQQILHIDVEKESKMILGRTKARRLDQKEICVIGGMPIRTESIEIATDLPDFSTNWQFDGLDAESRYVDALGFAKREYNRRKRIAEGLMILQKPEKRYTKKDVSGQQKG